MLVPRPGSFEAIFGQLLGLIVTQRSRHALQGIKRFRKSILKGLGSAQGWTAGVKGGGPTLGSGPE